MFGAILDGVERFPRHSLVELKLRAPVATGWSLRREHLLTRLDDGLPGRLVAISAPAGFGKTLLVAEWTRSLPEDVAVGWLALDPRDGEPARFWSYVVESLRRVGAEIDDRVVAEIAADPSAVEELIAVAVNALTELGSRHVLIIDDLHHLASADTVGSLFRFVEALPPTSVVVVITRTAPSWPLERLRARGEVEVIGAGDLAFTRDETDIVLAKMAPGVILDESEIDVLHRRSEGWPVAVTLAAHGLRRKRCPHQLVAEFGKCRSQGAAGGFPRCEGNP